MKIVHPIENLRIIGGSYSFNGKDGIDLGGAKDSGAQIIGTTVSYNDTNGIDLKTVFGFLPDNSGQAVHNKNVSFKNVSSHHNASNGMNIQFNIGNVFKDDVNGNQDHFGVDIAGGNYSDNGEAGIQINGASYVTIADALLQNNKIGINIRNGATPLTTERDPELIHSEQIVIQSAELIDNVQFGLQVLGASDVQLIGGNVTTSSGAGFGIHFSRQNEFVVDDPATSMPNDFVFPTHLTERIMIDGTVVRNSSNVGINIRDSDDITLRRVIAIGSKTTNLQVSEQTAKVTIVDSLFLDARFDEQTGNKNPITQQNVRFFDTSPGSNHDLQDYASHYFSTNPVGDDIPIDQLTGRLLSGDDDGESDGDDFDHVDRFFSEMLTVSELIDHLFPSP